VWSCRPRLRRSRVIRREQRRARLVLREWLRLVLREWLRLVLREWLRLVLP